MAVEGVLQPEQLKLFMTAPEIQGRVTGSIDQRIGESMPQMWNRKWEQSEHIYDAYEDEDDEGKMKGIGPNLRESITKQGYEERGPISITHTDFGEVTLPDAHHRVAVMGRLHPDQFLAVRQSTSMYNFSTTGTWMRDYYEKKRQKDRGR